MAKMKRLIINHAGGQSTFEVDDDSAVSYDDLQEKTAQQQARARQNIMAAGKEAVEAFCQAVAHIPASVIRCDSQSFHNYNTATEPAVEFFGDGFTFTRDQAANYSIVFFFPTQAGKTYELSFQLESGRILYGGIAKNDQVNTDRKIPTAMPTAYAVPFTTDNGLHTYSFTAKGSQYMLCFAVAYDSKPLKVSGISCVVSDARPVLRQEAMPERFQSISAIGKPVTLAEGAAAFTETATAIRSDGVRVTGLNRRPSTDYIDIQGCTSIRFGLNQFRASAEEVYNVISFFDGDKVYISGLPSQTNGYIASVIGVPANAVYVVGSWFDGLTEQPYMTGIYDNGLVEQVNTLRAADPLNAEQEEVVNATMSLPAFVSAINAQWEAYAALCKCVPWCFMPLRYVDSSYQPVPFSEICERINKNFRAEVANPNFSFADNCNRINHAFKRPVYRFADAKLNTRDTGNFVANMKQIVDFSLDTGMAKVEPSVIVSEDGNTMSVYAYNRRITTTDGVNWTPEEDLVMTDQSGQAYKGLIHVNVNCIDGVYYLLGCEANEGGAFCMMTSTDGLHFTLAGTVFPENHQFTAGKPVLQWGNSCIMKEYGSNTYYLYVEYRTDMNSGWEIGVVTATDLTIANDDGTIGNWQNPTSNPIMSKLWLTLDGSHAVGAGNPDFAKGEDNRPVKVNGRYFMYVHSSHYNATNISGLGSYTGGSQSNILRLSSENLLDWEVDGVMLDNRDIPEEDDPAAAKATSGNADHCIIQFKGRTYLFYSWNINHQTPGRAEYVHYMIDDRPIREILSCRP